MPIVKVKSIINRLQHEIGLDMRTKSSLQGLSQIVSDENAVSDELFPPEPATGSISNVRDSIGTIEHLETADGNTEQLKDGPTEDKSNIEAFQSQLQSEHAKVMILRETKTLSNDDKIVQIGLSTHSTSSTATRMDPHKLVRLMEKARTILSDERKKLFLAIQTFNRYNSQNALLDRQMQGVRLEQYYELKAEVNRIGEKLEKTNKSMNTSRKLFENDVARITHLREKMFHVQNTVCNVIQDAYDVQNTYHLCQQTLDEKLERKKQLRRTNQQLAQQIKSLNLLNWYWQIDQQIVQARSLIEKQNNNQSKISLRSVRD